MSTATPVLLCILCTACRNAMGACLCPITPLLLLLAEAWPAAKQVARLPGDYATPAFALWLGAHVWAYMSPHSYHVMQCLAASVPVMAGYAQTKRAAASGRLAAGVLPVISALPPPLLAGPLPPAPSPWVLQICVAALRTVFHAPCTPF